MFAFIILAHGIFLSYFRIVGAVVYTVYLLLLTLGETYLGNVGNWSVFAVLSNEYSGSKLLVNRDAIVVHVGVSLGLLMVSFLLWSRKESVSLSYNVGGKLQLLIQRLLLSVGFAGLVGVLVYSIYLRTHAAGTTHYGVVETEHFRFVYDESDSRVVNYLLDHVERDYTQLGALLGVKNLPSIRVDLTSTNEHAAGLATWKKIKINLNSFEDDLTQRRVLVHEATHVLQSVESDRAMAENISALKFFVEGMAQFTSFYVVPELQRRESNWDLASVAWKRQNIKFDDLIDTQSFSRQFDNELHYSLGDSWTNSLVDTCGSNVLGDFLRATGRESAPKDLPARLYWRNTMNEINCDLDTVNANWRKGNQQRYDRLNMSNFPEFHDVVARQYPQTDQVVIQANLRSYDEAFSRQNEENFIPDASSMDAIQAFTVPHHFSLRLGRDFTGFSPGIEPVFRGKVIVSEGQTVIEFRIPKRAIPEGTFRYQLGYAAAIDGRTYFEPWRRASF